MMRINVKQYRLEDFYKTLEKIIFSFQRSNLSEKLMKKTEMELKKQSQLDSKVCELEKNNVDEVKNLISNSDEIIVIDPTEENLDAEIFVDFEDSINSTLFLKEFKKFFQRTFVKEIGIEFNVNIDEKNNNLLHLRISACNPKTFEYDTSALINFINARKDQLFGVLALLRPSDEYKKIEHSIISLFEREIKAQREHLDSIREQYNMIFSCCNDDDLVTVYTQAITTCENTLKYMEEAFEQSGKNLDNKINFIVESFNTMDPEKNPFDLAENFILFKYLQDHAFLFHFKNLIKTFKSNCSDKNKYKKELDELKIISLKSVTEENKSKNAIIEYRAKFLKKIGINNIDEEDLLKFNVMNFVGKNKEKKLVEDKQDVFYCNPTDLANVDEVLQTQITKEKENDPIYEDLLRIIQDTPKVFEEKEDVRLDTTQSSSLNKTNSTLVISEPRPLNFVNKSNFEELTLQDFKNIYFKTNSKEKEQYNNGPFINRKKVLISLNNCIELLSALDNNLITKDLADEPIEFRHTFYQDTMEILLLTQFINSVLNRVNATPEKNVNIFFNNTFISPCPDKKSIGDEDIDYRSIMEIIPCIDNDVDVNIFTKAVKIFSMMHKELKEKKEQFLFKKNLFLELSQDIESYHQHFSKFFSESEVMKFAEMDKEHNNEKENQTNFKNNNNNMPPSVEKNEPVRTTIMYDRYKLQKLYEQDMLDFVKAESLRMYNEEKMANANVTKKDNVSEIIIDKPFVDVQTVNEENLSENSTEEQTNVAKIVEEKFIEKGVNLKEKSDLVNKSLQDEIIKEKKEEIATSTCNQASKMVLNNLNGDNDSDDDDDFSDEEKSDNEKKGPLKFRFVTK